MDRIKRLLAGIVAIAKRLPRKVVYVAVAALLVVLKARYPDANLPTADFVVDLVLALLACHTVTDVAAIVAAAVGERIAGRDKAGP